MAQQSKETGKQYFIPMIVTEETIKDFDIDRSKIRTMRIGNRKERVLPVPTDSREVYLAYIRDHWKEQKSADRQGRCVVTGKSGKPIRCPDSRKCEECEIYQEICKEENKPALLDFLVEQAAEPITEDPKMKAVEDEATLDKLIADLNKIRPEYGQIFKMLYDQETQAAIAQKLGMAPRTVSDKVRKVRELSQEMYKR